MKRTVSIFLAFIMIISVAGFSTLAPGGRDVLPSLKANAAFYTGSVISFGGYPQTRVTDSTTLSALNSIVKEWRSYGYYDNKSNQLDGNMKEGDWMRYSDVMYKNEKYRAVIFDYYRPYSTQSWAENPINPQYSSYQDDNGYNPGNIYYFKFEPLRWRVLDAAKGLVFCENGIDAQAFHNKVFYNRDDYNYYQSVSSKIFISDYEHSSIRQWLLKEFYNTAFSATEQELIAPTLIEADKTMNDKVFLLSYSEVLNKAYGFTDDTRKIVGTDYAKCQGLFVGTNGNSSWWLRTPGQTSSGASTVSSRGVAYNTPSNSWIAYYAVAPAFRFKSGITESNNPNGGKGNDTAKRFHVWDSGRITKAATYTAAGVKTYTCTVCKTTKTETIAKLKAPTVAKVSGLKVSKVKANAIKLAWSKAKNADKYEVYRSTDGKKWTKLTTTTKLAYTDKNVKAGTKYQYKVRGIHSASKATGTYSAVLKTQTLTAAPKISSLKSTKAKTATVKWGNVTGAKSYVVYTSKDGKKFTKAATTTKTSVTLSKLPAGKKVYVKVKAVNTYGKNSAYSAVKSVKVKK